MKLSDDILDRIDAIVPPGTVVVVDDSFDGVNLEEGNATLMNVTPSGMRELLRRKAVPASVRTIILAGEPVSSELVRKLYDNCNAKRVLNLYGHSEISLGSTMAELQPENEDKKAPFYLHLQVIFRSHFSKSNQKLN